MKIIPKMTFEKYIKEQKCPFRTNLQTNELMPCDSDCLALYVDEDNSYVCLRLVNLNYAINDSSPMLYIPSCEIIEEDEE